MIIQTTFIAEGNTRRPDLPEFVTGYSIVAVDGNNVTVDVQGDANQLERWALDEGLIQTSLSIAQRRAAIIAVSGKLKGNELTEKEIEELSLLFDPWMPLQAYEAGDLYYWDNTVIECKQSHTNTDPADTPDTEPSLWRIRRQPPNPQSRGRHK